LSRTQAVKVDGHTLTTAAVVAASRYAASIQLDECNRVRVDESRQVVVNKVTSGASIYGLSTGFGGSGKQHFCPPSSICSCWSFLIADTRTDKPLMLGHALLQHQHVGVLPTSGQPPNILPLQDPSTSTTMPESWVRSADFPFNSHLNSNDALSQSRDID
jgi:phenylalanine ammonia-lyase